MNSLINLLVILLLSSATINSKACSQNTEVNEELSEEDKAFIKQVQQGAKEAQEAARQAAISANDAAVAATTAYCAYNISQTNSDETITPHCEHNEAFVLTEEDKAFLRKVEENNRMMKEVGGKQAAELAARLAAESQAEASSECNNTESSTE